MDWHGIIVCDPQILVGLPTVKGTRISVELILEELASGHSMDDLLDWYPTLTHEGILAALAYAKDSLALDFVYPVVETVA